jgi:hypothetical protein
VELDTKDTLPVPEVEVSICLRIAANPVRDSKKPMSVAIVSSETVFGRANEGCINTVPTKIQSCNLSFYYAS